MRDNTDTVISRIINIRLPGLKLVNFLLHKINKRRKSDFILSTVFLNLILIVFQLVYISLRLKYLNEEIPFWYTKLWGDYQLAPPSHLYYLPLTSAFLLTGMLGIVYLLSKYFIRYIHEVASFFVTLWNLMLTYSVIRIIFLASTPFPPLINPTYFDLFIPMAVSFIFAYIVMPVFINYVVSKDIITNPIFHKHPAMILTRPTARGVGFLYGVMFIILSVLFVGMSKELLGIYVSVFMLSVLGIADDYQNTHPKSGYRALENPLLRLVLMTSAVSLIVLSGIRISQFNNPFGGLVNLDQSTVNIAGADFPYLSFAVSVLWIVWILNLLSWSNGIDGQYSGIVGIASIIIGILALRFTPLEPLHKSVSVMAMLSAGLAFGFTKHTWFPSRILWGFGAVSAGLVVAALSILVKSKVVVSVLIIFIPFLDAVVTVLRRIIQKKNPLRGDKGHLHHILLERGWSIPKVALFYWASTGLFGVIGLISSEKYLVRIGLSLIIVVGFFIMLLNLKSIKDKTRQ